MKIRSAGSLLRRLTNFVGHYEKLLLALLSVVIVISGTVWYREYSVAQKQGPSSGGTYVEAIVGNHQDIQTIAIKLTKAGLFTIDANGNLHNLLVSDWQANDDKSQFTFTLLDSVDAGAIKTTLEQSLDEVGPANVDLQGHKLTVTLSAPNPNLPLLLAQPLFDYGPYKLSKTTDKTAVFTRNTQQNAEPAYINKIILQLYENDQEVTTQVDKNRVNGALVSNTTTIYKGFTNQDISYQRYFILVLNQNRAPFRDDSSRQAVLNDQPNKPFTLTIVDEEPYITLANQLIDKWKATGVQITLDKKTKDEVNNKIAPARDYQAMLLGINYGEELDPYYIWDSSQIRPPGNNISGVKSDTIDQLIKQIRGTYNIPQRLQLITQLHTEIKKEGVAEVLGQDTDTFILSNSVHFQQPWLPNSLTDRWQAIGQWWID